MIFQKAHLCTLRFSVCEILHFPRSYENIMYLWTRLSYRCKLADGTARIALHLTVTSSKVNYPCSLPYLSQILRTIPQVSGSSPDSAFSKGWTSLNRGAFLRTIHKSKLTASDVTSEGLKVHTQQRFGNTRGADEPFLFAQMHGAWSKELDTHTMWFE